MIPSPTTSHQQVAGNFFLYFAQFVRLNEFGKVFYAPMDVVFGEGARREVAQPDIFL